MTRFQTPGTPLMRLVTALDGVGGLERRVAWIQESRSLFKQGLLILLRYGLRSRRTGRLSPDEVVELVDAYRAGATQAELVRRFGVHRQTVHQHLARQGVETLPRRMLSDMQEAEAVQLYTEELWTLAELVAKFTGVPQGFLSAGQIDEVVRLYEDCWCVGTDHRTLLQLTVNSKSRTNSAPSMPAFSSTAPAPSPLAQWGWTRQAHHTLIPR
jgi:hypothetical protein